MHFLLNKLVSHKTHLDIHPIEQTFFSQHFPVKFQLESPLDHWTKGRHGNRYLPVFMVNLSGFPLDVYVRQNQSRRDSISILSSVWCQYFQSWLNHASLLMGVSENGICPPKWQFQQGNWWTSGWNGLSPQFSDPDHWLKKNNVFLLVTWISFG